MKPNEMILLINDLCARLPYQTMVQVENDTAHTEPLELLGVDTSYGIVKLGETIDKMCFTHKERIGNVKPYLRSMSSMTEDEKEHFINTCIYLRGELSYWWTDETYDWLKENHFDYRELIPMGLALEAPTDMYNTKNY